MTSYQVSDRVKDIPEYLFAKLEKRVKELKAGGKRVVSLAIGDPHLPTPDVVIDALIEAVKNPLYHRYPLGWGLKEFRASVSNFLNKRFSVKVNEDFILPLIGSKDGIAHFPVGFVNPGDWVIVPSPAYPVYSIWSKFSGARIYEVPLLEKNGFLPELEKIPSKVLRNAKIMWLNYPNNPTTAVADPAFLKEVIRFAKKYNILIAYDNAYSEIYFSSPPHSILEFGKKNVIEFHSLSKTFNMTGWRIGWAVGDENIVKVLAKVKENTDSGVFHAIQYAGAIALSNYDRVVPPVREVYRKRREVFISALKNKGIKFFDGKATFYIWFKVPDGYTSSSYARKLIENGVVLTPGSGFGSVSNGWMRASLTANDADFDFAVKVLTEV